MVVVFVLAAWVTQLQMVYTPALREERANLERWIEGKAERPLCFRPLVPLAAAVVARAVPRVLGDSVCREPASWSVCQFMPPDSERRLPYFALAFIMFGSLVAYALVLGRTYRRLFQGSELATWVVAAGSLLAIAAVVIFGYCGHIYDFTFLALCAGMLSALLFERLPLYFVLFAISCWVKETTPLMTFAFLGIYWDRIPRRRLLLYLAGQVAAFVVAYGTVRLLFAHNGGANVEHWYAEELAWIGRKTAIKLALIASAIVAVFFRWRDKPAFLRRSFLSTVPVHLALFIYGARPGELRNLYESFPVVMLLLSRNFAIGPPAILSRVNQMRDHLRGSPQEAPAVSTGSQSVAATEPTGVGQTGPK